MSEKLRDPPLDKPYIFKAPDRYICSMFLGVKRRPIHGYGATMREAYFDWCIAVYGAREAK